ncbi:tetratricopeptide repeat protein 29 isoform X2 [Esox lucius]|nr:tetratricopeptide repeat protein 29 isoform X2 [Esox lucius]
MSASVARRQKVNFLPDINKPEKRSPAHERTSPRPRSRIQNKKKENEPKSTGIIQTPTISKDEVAMFRSSVWKNTCVELLRGGFHRSFSELSSLLRHWKEVREAAGPGSVIWQQISLEEQPTKLHTLQHYLTRAETAQRAGVWSEVYDNQLCLAQYFRDTDDMWLSSHFYQASLASAQRVKMDGGRKEAEASSNMGRVYMEEGQLDSAREIYERFYKLTAGQSWRDDGGVCLHTQACQSLCGVYTQLANLLLQADDHRPAIQTLNKAFQRAKEAGDRRVEGEVAYRLGLAYQCVGDQVTAKCFLNMYLEISTLLGDADRLGKAYKAIAKSLECEGKLNETLQYLEKFAEVSQSNNQHHHLEEACMCLGVIFTSRGQYDRGCAYFERAYEIARDLDEVPLVQRAQVCVGSAKAHSLIRKFSHHIETASHSNLRLLTAWKDRREDVFSDTTSQNTSTQQTCETSQNSSTQQTCETSQNSSTQQTCETSQNSSTQQTCETSQNSSTQQTCETSQNSSTQQT